jgi:hypothetical protein
MRIESVLIVMLLAAVCLSGCMDTPMAPVKGRVLCNGKPVVAAQVTFSPVPKYKEDSEPGKASTGFSDAEGVFVLSTHKELDGAQVGQHNVTVTLDDANPALCKRHVQIKVEVTRGPNEFNLELNQ